MASRIEVHNLRKSFGTISAVNDISCEVEAGDVLGFLGPNGAGKTTAMRMITGYLMPDEGSVSICGIDVLKHPVAAKGKFGYLPEGAPLYPEMTPYSFLGFVARIRGIEGSAKEKRLGELAELVHLKDVWKQPIETLSKGFKRRLGLAQAILHDPPALILDEPTDGLDPNQKREVRDLVRTMAEDKAIIISTHILEEVRDVCSRAIIIARGKIVADGTPLELETMSSYHNAVSILVSADQEESLTDALHNVPGVERVSSAAGNGDMVICTAFPREGGPILTEIANLLNAGPWHIQELRQESGRLDEVFHTLTVPARETTEGGRI
ncbi:MAG: ABC transporter ATP-binding protein [Deltaproteobacteria bacterium]|nr:ABC transporter ATP-binding protein [Deltaproteobacteria bacterium]